MVKPKIEAERPINAWEIAGIRHEIFQRILAGIRHELVGPVSVSRMAISVLKRTLDKGDPGKEAIQQQVTRMDEQMQQSVLGIRGLSVWDADSTALANADDAIRYGLKLMAYRLSMRGITVDADEVAEQYLSLDESAESNAGSTADDISTTQISQQVPHQAFLYAWLGLLGHVEDCHYPAALKLSRALPAVLCVQLMPAPEKSTELPAEIKPNRHIIDQQALLGLTGDCGIKLEFTPGQISLVWNPAST